MPKLKTKKFYKEYSKLSRQHQWRRRISYLNYLNQNSVTINEVCGNGRLNENTTVEDKSIIVPTNETQEEIGLVLQSEEIEINAYLPKHSEHYKKGNLSTD